MLSLDVGGGDLVLPQFECTKLGRLPVGGLTLLEEWMRIDRRLLIVTRLRWSDDNGIFPMGLVSLGDTRETFLRFFPSFTPSSLASFCYKGSLKWQLKSSSHDRSPRRVCPASISMWGFEPPELLVQASVFVLFCYSGSTG